MSFEFSKEDALMVIDDEQAQWLRLVGRVGTDRMEVPGVAGVWTFKDVTAHLSFWMQDVVLTLEAVARNEKPAPFHPWPAELEGDFEAINQWAWKQSRDRTVTDVLDEASGIYDRMRAAVESLSEETLNSTDLFDWQNGEPFAKWLIDRRLFNHFYREHQDRIMAWLATS